MGNKYKSNKNLNNMKKFFFIALIALALCGCQNKQSSMSQSSETDNVSQTSNTTDSNTKSQTRANTWVYSQDVDDLTGAVTSVNANLYSDNKVVYDQYDNLAVQAAICISAERDKTYVLIALLNGKDGHARFADIQSSGFLAVFDDGEVDDTWSLVSSYENKTYLAINTRNKVDLFIQKLKQSKTCKIQLNLDVVGPKTFIFNTEGLKWDY